MTLREEYENYYKGACMKYKAVVRAILKQEYEIEANSRDEAIKIAEKKFNEDRTRSDFDFSNYRSIICGMIISI